MTQNTSYSGSSMSEDHRSHDSQEHQSSSEIRADIDQTRSAVGAKIDALQARLDPDRLKQQAQTTVQEVIHDTANTMTDYVRTHRDDITHSLADAARRNPLPTALVGLGIGWLILESISGGKSEEHEDRERWQAERRYYSPPTPRRRMRRQDQWSQQQWNQGQSQWNQGQMRQGQMGQGEWNQGRGLAGQEFSDEYAEEYVHYTPSAYQGAAESEGQYGNGKRHGNPLSKAAGAVKDTMSDVTDDIKDRMSSAGQEIKDRMENVRDQMSDTQSQMRDQMGERMGDMRHQAQHMGERGQHMGQQFRERRHDLMQQGRGQMQQQWRRARYEGRRRGQQVMRNLEDNPLTYGALALAAGAALAILLPQTRTENRVFGETRDHLMDRGEEAIDMARERAMHVAEELRPELEDTARKLADDVKEAGKNVAQQAKEDIKPAMDKAMEKTKEEAKGAAQEVKGKAQGNQSGNQSSSMASGMALNKDTLRGQWNQIKGDVKSKWGKLTDDELTRIEGDYDKLIGTLQSRYGYERARAEREINDFFKSKA